LIPGMYLRVAAIDSFDCGQIEDPPPNVVFLTLSRIPSFVGTRAMLLRRADIGEVSKADFDRPEPLDVVFGDCCVLRELLANSLGDSPGGSPAENGASSREKTIRSGGNSAFDASALDRLGDVVAHHVGTHLCR